MPTSRRWSKPCDTLLDNTLFKQLDTGAQKKKEASSSYFCITCFVGSKKKTERRLEQCLALSFFEGTPFWLALSRDANRKTIN